MNSMPTLFSCAKCRKRIMLLAALLVIIIMIPFPTQICPTIEIQLLNEDGTTAHFGDGLTAKWDGVDTGVGNDGGFLRFGRDAKLRVPRKVLYAGIMERVIRRMGEMVPHGEGFRTTRKAVIMFEVPADHVLDVQKTGLTPTLTDGFWTVSNYGTLQIQPLHPGVSNRLFFSVDDPASWGTTACKVGMIWRKK